MLAVLVALSLSLSAPAKGSRLEVCGRTLVPNPRPLILPRTSPTFAPLVVAPGSFREEAMDARPRSFAQIPCSPSVCDDFQARDRFARSTPWAAPTRPPGKRHAPPKVR